MYLNLFKNPRFVFRHVPSRAKVATPLIAKIESVDTYFFVPFFTQGIQIYYLTAENSRLGLFRTEYGTALTISRTKDIYIKYQKQNGLFNLLFELR